MKPHDFRVRGLRAFVVYLVLATSGFVPGIPNLVRSTAETTIHWISGDADLAEHDDDDCAAKDAKGTCEGCPLTCTRCACAIKRALLTEPKITFRSPVAAVDLIPTPYESLVSDSPVVSIFHPPRA